MSFRVYQRRAGVESNVWFAGDQRAVGKARIRRRIFNEQKTFGQNRVRAERIFPRSFGSLDTDFRFEPLPFSIDERQSGERHPADVGSDLHHIIELTFGCAIEDLVIPQRLEASDLAF